MKAIQNGYDALFTTATEMITAMTEAEKKGRASELLPKYLSPDVLVIDEMDTFPMGRMRQM